MMPENGMTIWSSISLDLYEDIACVGQEGENEFVWEWLELKPMGYL
jgi:hypothetical protein